jgi:hypothetical protein
MYVGRSYSMYLMEHKYIKKITVVEKICNVCTFTFPNIGNKENPGDSLLENAPKILSDTSV